MFNRRRVFLRSWVNCNIYFFFQSLQGGGSEDDLFSTADGSEPDGTQQFVWWFGNIAGADSSGVHLQDIDDETPTFPIAAYVCQMPAFNKLAGIKKK